jgi:hypothetical protein
MLFQLAPTADSQWAEAIVAADPLWGSDEEWKFLIDQTTTEADPPRPPQLDHVDNVEPSTPPADPDDPEPSSTAEKHEAELAALAAELQDLFRP